MDASTAAGVDLDRLMAERFLRRGDWYVSSARSDSVIVKDGSPWMPSSDIGAAWEVEAAIPENRREVYTAALVQEVDPDSMIFGSCIECEPHGAGKDGWQFVYAVAHASPLQRCRAALKAATVPSEQP